MDIVPTYHFSYLISFFCYSTRPSTLTASALVVLSTSVFTRLALANFRSWLKSYRISKAFPDPCVEEQHTLHPLCPPHTQDFFSMVYIPNILQYTILAAILFFFFVPLCLLAPPALECRYFVHLITASRTVLNP